MSFSKNFHKLPDIVITDTPANNIDEEEVDNTTPKSCTYSVTVSKKPLEDPPFCSGQKSFISIHSTDNLCQVSGVDSLNIDECNVEVISLNEVFPSTSEESLSNSSPVPRKHRDNKTGVPKCQSESSAKCYVPSNSKSSTMPRQTDPLEGTSVHSDFDIPKSTMYVVGSNPGEPKMSYNDTPKKFSKTMKKFLRNVDKQKSELNKQTVKELTTRGILKDRLCVPECTGDSEDRGAECFSPEDLTLPFPMDFNPQTYYSKQSSDKNVKFNTQVVIIHFRGDLCVGQSVETLSKENDQQARNSELRKAFLTKYNEFWPTHK